MRIGRLAVGATAVVAVVAVLTTVAGAHTSHARASLAYARGLSSASVWVGAGSAARRVGSGDSPMLAPNGRRVAVSLNARGAALAILSVSGGGRHGFFHASRDYATALAWSHDSRYLAVGLYATTALKSYGNGGLAVIDTRTWKVTMLAHGYVQQASFAPTGDRLVYGLSRAQSIGARVNLFTARANGAGTRRITSDGRSLNPVWGRKGIVFDRERVRGKYGFPAFQLWLLTRHGQRQLTHLRIPLLVAGLAPYAVSANGNRLMAVYGGQDTDYAWYVQISPLRVGPVKVGGQLVQQGGISRDGKRMLVSQGAFEQAPSHGIVEWVPFFGGTAHKLASGAQPSWNR